jgi:uncharacterized membrane protein
MLGERNRRTFMLVLILGLVIFLGVHSVRIVAPQVREARVSASGLGAWKGIYTIVSLVGFVLIVWGYGMARQTAPILYEPPAALKHVAVLLMLFAMIALAAFMLPAGRIKAALKHPMLVAVKIWALAHLLANGDLASLVLFLAFLAWAVADRISVKRRGAPVPVAGPPVWDAAALGLGLVLFLLFVWRLHVWLIGVSPFG